MDLAVNTKTHNYRFGPRGESPIVSYMRGTEAYQFSAVNKGRSVS